MNGQMSLLLLESWLLKLSSIFVADSHAFVGVPAAEEILDVPDSSSSWNKASMCRNTE